MEQFDMGTSMFVSSVCGFQLPCSRFIGLGPGVDGGVENSSRPRMLLDGIVPVIIKEVQPDNECRTKRVLLRVPAAA